MIRIGVIGGENPKGEILSLAYETGKEIARNNCILICGGLSGIMEAACKGAKEEKGLTIGILPGIDAASSNPYVDIPIVTGIGYARNIIVVLSSCAIIAIDGSYGTLSEIAYGLQFKKPIIGLYTWDFSYELAEIPLIKANSPKSAVSQAMANCKLQCV
ncbi:MAG: TIGR00725 family protein [bacterium]